VNSPSKTPKKVITKAALAHGHFVEIAPKKNGFKGILLLDNVSHSSYQ
jgi:hypothetical protein